MNRNIYIFSKIRYPWLKNLPNNWPMLVMLLESYKPHIQGTTVNWKPPSNGFAKCNSDGAPRGNPGPSVGTFCIRDSAGNFIFANSFDCSILINQEANVCSFKRGLEYCFNKLLLPVFIETDSFILKKIIMESGKFLGKLQEILRKLKG